jgi:hypothetical protein
MRKKVAAYNKIRLHDKNGKVHDFYDDHMKKMKEKEIIDAVHKNEEEEKRNADPMLNGTYESLRPKDKIG